MKRQIAISIIVIIALLSVVILAACGSGNLSGSSAGASSTATIDPQTLMTQQCTRCHALTRVTSKTMTATQWKVTLDRMIGHGAQLSSSEEQALVSYLARNY